ncbi:MAG: hypothetical protein PHP85_13715 [Gallionella sp.]|nr:hypothetical protein [Gallionella sp.]
MSLNAKNNPVGSEAVREGAHHEMLHAEQMRVQAERALSAATQEKILVIEQVTQEALRRTALEVEALRVAQERLEAEARANAATEAKIAAELLAVKSANQRTEMELRAQSIAEAAQQLNEQVNREAHDKEMSSVRALSIVKQRLDIESRAVKNKEEFIQTETRAIAALHKQMHEAKLAHEQALLNTANMARQRMAEEQRVIELEKERAQSEEMALIAAKKQAETIRADIELAREREWAAKLAEQAHLTQGLELQAQLEKRSALEIEALISVQSRILAEYEAVLLIQGHEQVLCRVMATEQDKIRHDELTELAVQQRAEIAKVVKFAAVESEQMARHLAEQEQRRLEQELELQAQLAKRTSQEAEALVTVHARILLEHEALRSAKEREKAPTIDANQSVIQRDQSTVAVMQQHAEIAEVVKLAVAESEQIARYLLEQEQKRLEQELEFQAQLVKRCSLEAAALVTMQARILAEHEALRLAHGYGKAQVIKAEQDQIQRNEPPTLQLAEQPLRGSQKKSDSNKKARASVLTEQNPAARMTLPAALPDKDVTPESASLPDAAPQENPQVGQMARQLEANLAIIAGQAEQVAVRRRQAHSQSSLAETHLQEASRQAEEALAEVNNPPEAKADDTPVAPKKTTDNAVGESRERMTRPLSVEPSELPPVRPLAHVKAGKAAGLISATTLLNYFWSLYGGRTHDEMQHVESDEKSTGEPAIKPGHLKHPGKRTPVGE